MRTFHLRATGRAGDNKRQRPTEASTAMKIINQTRPSTPAQPLDPGQLDFGKMFTPNFFVADYRSGEWRNPRIQPLEPFSLHPASLVFHYAQTVFEGLKAFRQDDGTVAVFRPDMNARR